MGGGTQLAFHGKTTSMMAPPPKKLQMDQWTPTCDNLMQPPPPTLAASRVLILAVGEHFNGARIYRKIIPRLDKKTPTRLESVLHTPNGQNSEKAILWTSPGWDGWQELPALPDTSTVALGPRWVERTARQDSQKAGSLGEPHRAVDTPARQLQGPMRGPFGASRANLYCFLPLKQGNHGFCGRFLWTYVKY